MRVINHSKVIYEEFRLPARKVHSWLYRKRNNLKPDDMISFAGSSTCTDLEFTCDNDYELYSKINELELDGVTYRGLLIMKKTENIIYPWNKSQDIFKFTYAAKVDFFAVNQK